MATFFTSLNPNKKPSSHVTGARSYLNPDSAPFLQFKPINSFTFRAPGIRLLYNRQRICAHFGQGLDILYFSSFLLDLRRMSVIDILTRVDAICNKYDKYDIEKHKENQISGTDAFARLYSVVEADIEAAMQKANDAASEKNRAVVATLNAEIRRTKGRLNEEIPKLQRLAQKKVKGLSTEEFATRNDLVLALIDKIESIPDGTGTGTKRTGAWKTSTTRMEIKFDSSTPEGGMHTEYYEHSEESKQFRQDFDMRKAKQDQGLDMISEGLDTLKYMAQDINEELDRQVPLIDEIDTKVDKATSDLKNTNVRLKDTVTKLRSSRNFCIDIVLLCIILGIAAYLYNVLKK